MFLIFKLIALSHGSRLAWCLIEDPEEFCTTQYPSSLWLPGESRCFIFTGDNFTWSLLLSCSALLCASAEENRYLRYEAMDYCRTIGVPPGFRSRLAWLDRLDVVTNVADAYPRMTTAHWFASRQPQDSVIEDPVRGTGDGMVCNGQSCRPSSSSTK